MLNEAQFDRIFPFHFTVGDDLEIVRVGRSLASIGRDLAPGRPFLSVFEVERPESTATVDGDWLRRRHDQLFVLRHRVSGLQLRGEWLVRDGVSGSLTFIGSPWLTHPDQLTEFGLNVGDFAIHDPMVDLLQMAQAQQMAFDDVKQLAAKLTHQRSELRAVNQQLAEQNAVLVATDRRLREQEAEARKLALVAARTTNAVIVTDALGRIEWANRAFTRLTGYELEEVRGRTPGAVLQGPGTDPAIVQKMQQFLRRGEGFEQDVLNYDKAGRPYIVHIEVQPIRDEQGKVTNFMAIESDVTERVRHDLRRTLRETISRALAGADTLRAGIEPTIEAITRLLEFQVGISWNVPRGRPALEQEYAWHDGTVALENFVAETRKFIFRPGEGLPGRVWRDKAVCWISDVAQDANFPRAALAARAGLTRAIALPVQIAGEVVGVMEFLGSRHFLPDGELPRFLQEVGNQVGLFVARVRAQEALRQERDFATQVMSLMGQGIAVTGVDRRIEYCNDAFAALLGRPAAEWVGRIPLDLLTAAERQKFSNRWWYRASRQRMAFETRLERADGSPVYVLITSVPRLRDGEPWGHIATVTDLSDRKQVEETLRLAKEAAETASRAKNDFLATVSHEIRTPMNAVLGMTSLLRETRLDARQLEFVEAVRTSSESLLEIIDDILDFSKIESSRLTLTEQNFEVVAVVESVLDLLAPRAHDKGLELTAIVDPAIPRGLKGDEGRLRQILVNLLGNGIKFTARGEVVLRVGREVDEAARAHLRFTVTDTGIGIPVEQQEAVFEPFVQADNTSARHFEGTGLGLTISKRLVALLGGRMGLESRPGEGSTFWFTIPLVESGQTVPALHDPALANLRVLLMENHAAARESIVAMMRPWGVRLETTGRPAVALESLETAVEQGDPFKVVLLDSRSMGESGQQIAARIAAALGSARPRVVLFTRATDPGMAGRVDGPVDAKIAKPLKPAKLFHCLLAVVTGRPPPAGGFAVIPAGGPANCDLRILVVEDREINQRFARLMLERIGYQADFVVNGREAVDAAQRTPYDVIFMDCQMPVMDGYEATREIRRLEALAPPAQRRPARIIAMTANAVADNRGQCLAAGMDDFISKPVRIELVREVLGVVRPQAAERAAPVAPWPPGEALPPESEAGIALLQTEFGDAAAAEMLALFLRDTPERMAELVRLRAEGDGANLARTAHMMAGSCGIFGLTAMRVACLQAETGCGQHSPGEFAAALAGIEQGFAAVRPALERRLHELSAKPPSAP